MYWVGHRIFTGELSSHGLSFYRKLSEKLFSAAASANDVNEARCNPLICEPTVYNFKLMPQDYALILMTDKVYQMYLKAGRYLSIEMQNIIHVSFQVSQRMNYLLIFLDFYANSKVPQIYLKVFLRRLNKISETITKIPMKILIWKVWRY